MSVTEPVGNNGNVVRLQWENIEDMFVTERVSNNATEVKVVQLPHMPTKDVTPVVFAPRISMGEHAE